MDNSIQDTDGKMDNSIQGIDITNTIIWEGAQLENHWIATGIANLLTRHTSANSLVEFYLNQYSHTDTVRTVIDGMYYMVRINEIPVRAYMDILAEKLHLGESQ